MRIVKNLLGSPGARLHTIILVLGIVYVCVHVALGMHLVSRDAPITGFLLAITVAAALGNVLVVVPVWVVTIAALLRGPKPLVPLPTPVEDEALPEIVVQIPGRNEPFDEVRRSIDSVLDAAYPADKVTVQFVDNSDDDRWQAVAEHYAGEPRVKVEHRDGTRGFKGGNLNYGLDQLGRFEDPSRVLIGLLDVGDTFAPKVLRPMATEFVHDPKLGFVQDMFRIGNPRDTIINWSDSYVGDASRRFHEGYMAHFGLATMNGHCALLRLCALEDTGRWNESRIAEDWSTGITMAVRGWHGKWVDYDPTDPDMVSTELVPGDIAAQQKQKRRWATGGTELAKLYLGDWLRSPLPWHQKMSLVLRLGANVNALPGFLIQLTFPVWLALVVLSEGHSVVLTFGLAAALLQEPYLLANLAAAVNLAREGRWRTAAWVVIAYPVQALWRLPVFAHAGIGIAEGLTKGLKAFVVTPKQQERASILRILEAQRLVLMISILALLPSLVAIALRPDRVSGVVIAAATMPILTVAALFLVPSTQWVRAKVRRFAKN